MVKKIGIETYEYVRSKKRVKKILYWSISRVELVKTGQNWSKMIETDRRVYERVAGVPDADDLWSKRPKIWSNRESTGQTQENTDRMRRNTGQTRRKCWSEGFVDHTREQISVKTQKRKKAREKWIKHWRKRGEKGVERISGQMVKWSNGQMAEWSNGRESVSVCIAPKESV